VAPIPYRQSFPKNRDGEKEEKKKRNIIYGLYTDQFDPVKRFVFTRF
jgi:hypothetical protein